MKAQLIPEYKLSVPEQITLRKQLDQFYSNVTDYTAFAKPSSQHIAWTHLELSINEKLQKSKRVINILEIGSGMSGFGKWLKERDLRNKVSWSAQDVTGKNATWLEKEADKTFYGDISVINSTNHFDIIFSTYVLEHVSNPAIHLNYLYTLLRPEGSLFIFCPRYDLPGYFCPSSRHLGWSSQLKFGLQWAFFRLSSLVTHKPIFLIQTDLAAFHKPFFTDADAVHWVSMLDLKNWARSKRAFFKSLEYGHSRKWTKDWIVKRFLTCAVEIQKEVYTKNS